MNTRERICIVFVAALLVVGAATHCAAASSITIQQSLSATGVDPNASGQLQAQISNLKSGMRGKLYLKALQLDPSANYVVLLNGVPIGSLTTTPGGKGRARFSSQPRRRDQLLGVDPRGSQIEVRNANGDDVLETTVPTPGVDPTKIHCCIAQSEDSGTQPECEDLTPDACTAAGGVDSGASSCLPNPCQGTAPPPPQDNVVCCTPEGDGVTDQGDDGGTDNAGECELRSATSCSAHGGINLGAGTCDSNPCSATTPTNPQTVQCCMSDGEETECHQRTADKCTGDGGTNMGAGTCNPNPCTSTPPADQVACCVPDNGGSECEQRTADQCTAQGGTSMGAGNCDSNPCASATPAAQVQCCVTTDSGGLECVLRTANGCADRGGTNVGAGMCDPRACAGVPAPPPPIRCCLAGGERDNGGLECEHLTDQQCAAKGGTTMGTGSCDPNPCG